MRNIRFQVSFARWMMSLPPPSRLIFLGEEFSFTDAIGTALIILGVGFYAWSDARAAKVPAEG